MELVLNWISREGSIFLTWWLLVSIAGWTVMPLAWRLLGGLPDRGYTLSKALGLMLIGFTYWLLVSLGLLGNGVGGVIAAWLIVLVVAVVGLWLLPGRVPSWREYWQENRTVMLTTEVIFFVLFFTWFLYRAYIPDTYSTEKPMELMFISSIMRSDTFPPNDAWLAGYSISYYYFGYVIAAMLSMVSGVSSGIGFSAMISMLFGLVGTTAFGLGYNLVRARTMWSDEDCSPAEKHLSQARYKPLAAGFLALFCVLLMSNLEMPLVEVPYETRLATEDYLNFWGQPRTSFDNLAGYTSDPNATLSLTPTNWSYWWWFGAARVLGDYDLAGNQVGEPITEFPAFSFILGDTHPHVLSLPFVIMTLGLALNLLLTWRSPNRYQVVLYGLVIGGLIFMNTWDGPIYLAALVGTDALRRLMRQRGRLHLSDWLALILFGVELLAIAVVAYLPFLIAFRSQAAGFLPNLINPAYLPRLFLVIGPPLILAGSLVLVEAWRGRRRMNWSLGLTVGLGLLAIMVIFMLMLTLLSSFNPMLYGRVQGFVDQYGGWAGVLPLFLERRLTHGVTSLILLAFIVLIVARLFPRQRTADEVVSGAEAPIVTYSPSAGFALLLVGIGVTLLFIPDFVFLRDAFWSRSNTTFKFYYQAWVTLGLAGSYGTYTILADGKLRLPALPLRLVYGAVLALLIVMGSLYIIAASHYRAVIERGSPSYLSVDGGSLGLSNDIVQSVQCLAELVGPDDDVIVAEAARDTYNPSYGRVGTMTGIPNLLGWPGHESQWRGATYGETAGSRQGDLQQLYSATAWNVAQQIIDKYGIDYVVIGSTERNTYEPRENSVVPLQEDMFAANSTLVCSYGNEHIYRVRPNTAD
ncbi:hypothetical protein G4Y79_18040 [Phototrophicus methaneseepsis]|uniref:Uncharacterized protein n=1 Tax=Phototrophicus methaneseepsis TaxID=2710758 RepID=A0A7S8E723_9CHLR|nr:DUF2298 domain-containing protein [Phototrophicus methaneseepsis]QPC81576.1 hypothetical protein G4Y79_18040 [Phototrophicus methaneseepsis]